MSSQKRSKTSQPQLTHHDRFARKYLPYPGIASDLLRFYADPVLDREIDLDALRPAPTHSINRKLQEVIRDISFITHLKNNETPAEVLFVLEHKSHPNPFVALQLATQSLLVLYSDWVEKGYTAAGSYKPTIPIMVILYHGTEDWASQELWFQDIFKNLPPELKVLVPQFKIIVINLARFSYDNLPGRPETQAFVESLKRAMDGTFTEHLGNIFRRIREAGLDETPMHDFVESIASYCSYSVPFSDEQYKMALIKAFDESEGLEMYKTMPKGFVRDAFERGLAEGEEKGEKKEKTKSIVETLRFRFGKVPPETIKSLKMIKSSAVLRFLFKHAMACSTLDEFTRTLQNDPNDCSANG